MTEREKLKMIWASQPQLALMLTDTVPDFELSDFSFDVFPMESAWGWSNKMKLSLMTKSNRFRISIIRGKHCYNNDGEVEIAIFDNEREGNWALPSVIVPKLQELNIPIGEYRGMTDEEFEEGANAVIGYLPYEDCIKLLVSL